MGGANPIVSLNRVCTLRSKEPGGLSTCLNKSFSPKAKTGTKDALESAHRCTYENHCLPILTSSTLLSSVITTAIRLKQFEH